MFNLRRLVAGAVLATTAASAQAATYSFQTIDNPADPTFNQLLGIGDASVISGYFGSGAVGHPNQGYLVRKPYTLYLTGNLPGSIQTQATGLNPAGYVTGFWSDTNLGMGDANFGFVRSIKNNVNTYIDVNNPAVSSTPHVNQVLGINMTGNAAGFFNDAGGNPHAYVYSITTGKFTNLSLPAGAVSQAATGINKTNLVSGFLTTSVGRTVGFLRQLSGGSPILFGVPGSNFTQFLGVNDTGVAVGFYNDKNNISHGVIYDPASGNWTGVNAPNAPGGTVLNGLNNINQIVGFDTDAAGNVHGLLVTVTP